MKDIIDKGFNDFFLNEISKFDSEKYAYDTFFNCDKNRFSKIASAYHVQNGNSASKYMLNTFYSWKNGSVRPNSNSRYNIIASVTSTFTIEEKFVEAYSRLANHIKFSFPRRILLKDVNGTFEQIIMKIESFNLNNTSYYAKYIYSSNEIEEYQSYIQNIFKFYTKTIFDNLNKDIELFIKVYKDVNTSFLTTSFHTYLYNIEIDIHNAIDRKFELRKIFELEHPISYEKLLNNKIMNFSLEQVSKIAKANDTTKIDVFLSKIEIDKIVKWKNELENSRNKGSISMNLKTNSGVLNINLRILSPNEKALIIARVFGFIIAVPILVYYCFVLSTSVFIFIGGLFALSYLIMPIFSDILDYANDVLNHNNNGRK